MKRLPWVTEGGSPLDVGMVGSAQVGWLSPSPPRVCGAHPAVRRVPADPNLFHMRIMETRNDEWWRPGTIN